MTRQLTRAMHAARRERRWTQTVLAEKLGVTQGTISFWENGVESPALAHQLDILELMPEVMDRIEDETLDLLDRVQALERQLFDGQCSCDNCRCPTDAAYTPISEAVRQRQTGAESAAEHVTKG